MADEDEEYSYAPNAAVIQAVRASGVQGARGVSGASGLGPARADPPSTSGPDLSGVRSPRRRAEIMARYQQAQATAAHQSAQDSIARATYALHAADSFYKNAKARSEMVQQANQLNQAANFYAEHANLNPYAPDYYQHVNALAAKYPGATENKGVQAILANPKLREQAALKGDLPGEVYTQKAMQAGWLKPADFNNPQLHNQDGSFNHDAAAQLAAMREGASVEPPHIKSARATLEMISKAGIDLTPAQEQSRDIATNQILQFQKGQQSAMGVPPAPKVDARSFFPRASMTPVQNNPAVQPTAPPPQTSIPKAPPPPTPAPTPISPDKADEYLNQYQ